MAPADADSRNAVRSPIIARGVPSLLRGLTLGAAVIATYLLALDQLPEAGARAPSFADLLHLRPFAATGRFLAVGIAAASTLWIEPFKRRAGRWTPRVTPAT